MQNSLFCCFQKYGILHFHRLTRIGLISDTHGFLDESVFRHFADCDEIWHAGDWGHESVSDMLRNNTRAQIRGVYGNIDGGDIRSLYPEKLFFRCEEVNVFITHIGGYPPKYVKGIKDEILANKSGLFISGHSHILKIMYDQALQCLHMNPGAAGRQGWQTVRTLIRFSIEGSDIRNAEVIELG